MRHALFPLLALLLTLAACHDDKPHVFQSPAPRPATTGRVAATNPSVPDAPLGSFADARITSIVDAATGMPVPLTDISRAIEVMTGSARGPTRPASESARVELMMHGVTEARQTLVLPAPASTIVAHAFSIPAVSDTRSGLIAGRYTLQVRIIGGDWTVLATSVPLHIELR